MKKFIVVLGMAILGAISLGAEGIEPSGEMTKSESFMKAFGMGADSKPAEGGESGSEVPKEASTHVVAAQAAASGVSTQGIKPSFTPYSYSNLKK